MPSSGVCEQVEKVFSWRFAQFDWFKFVSLFFRVRCVFYYSARLAMCSLRLVYKQITQDAPGSAVIRNFTVVPEVMLLYTDHVYTLVTCTGVNFGHFRVRLRGV